VKGPELFARGPLALLATGTGLLIVVLWLRGGLVSVVDLVRVRVTEGLSRGASRQSPERSPIGPAPASETRKARLYRSVRSSGTIALACGTIAGLVAVARLPLDRPTEVMWLGAAGLGVLTLCTWAGWSRPAIVPAALVATVGAFGAVEFPDAVFVTLVAALFAFGGAVRLSASSVGQPLVAAARGWSTVQLIAGAAVGGIIGSWSTEPTSWTIAGALLLLAVAVFSPAVEPRSTPAATDDAALRVRSLSLRVGGTTLLAGVDFTVSSGQIIGIVGANGTGKSTLLRCVAAEIAPDAGSVSVHGVDTAMLSPDELARTSFLLCDAEPGSNGELTVADNLRLAAATSHDPSVIDDVVGAVAAIHPSLVARFDDPAAVLSGGERRILATAQALIVQPRVLLADELARGLTGHSLEVYRAAMRMLAARGTAVVVVDHANDGVEAIADHILTLEAGALHVQVPQPC
jgi:branched-chain amino acid transport system ATP-binding protein